MLELVGSSRDSSRLIGDSLRVKATVPHGSFWKRDKGIRHLRLPRRYPPDLAETIPSNPGLTPRGSGLSAKATPKILRVQSLTPGVSRFSSFFLQLITGAYCRSILRGLCFVPKVSPLHMYRRQMPKRHSWSN